MAHFYWLLQGLLSFTSLLTRTGQLFCCFLFFADVNSCARLLTLLEKVKQILTKPCGHSRDHLERPPAADHKTDHTHTHTHTRAYTHCVAFHITSSLSEWAHYCQDLALTLGQPALLCDSTEVICALVTLPRTTRQGSQERGKTRGRKRGLRLSDRQRRLRRAGRVITYIISIFFLCTPLAQPPCYWGILMSGSLFLFTSINTPVLQS